MECWSNLGESWGVWESSEHLGRGGALGRVRVVWERFVALGRVLECIETLDTLGTLCYCKNVCDTSGTLMIL